MTHQEKAKRIAEIYETAKSWNSDFVRKQFIMSWQVQREIEEMYKDADLLTRTNAVESCKITRQAYIKILEERHEL